MRRGTAVQVTYQIDLSERRLVYSSLKQIHIALREPVPVGLVSGLDLRPRSASDPVYPPLEDNPRQCVRNT